MPLTKAEVARRYRARHPEHASRGLAWKRAARKRAGISVRTADTKSHLRNRYGITQEQYEQMLFIQDGMCAVCGTPPTSHRLHVDHDHDTGRVRALLCQTCNRHRVGANTPETARQVLALLESEFDGRAL